ncbi:Hypothetical Protein FCC1311_060322 [Hondaea fermentalgiana]|uniref:Uncharacterized protein n=1 Tax=Hondaea fermentalgiana TaxID=2315210 RepID=A0A2R5GFV8_9STRA|nr:Hypothetical Protein FCC1311_060322 [Hondaea fermentalgiana]|eukprot:GBG29812.1 Hypothetical Protein FCC1311_060322 [Hondaea fermentalgiana]
MLAKLDESIDVCAYPIRAAFALAAFENASSQYPGMARLDIRTLRRSQCAMSNVILSRLGGHVELFSLDVSGTNVGVGGQFLGLHWRAIREKGGRYEVNDLPVNALAASLILRTMAEIKKKVVGSRPHKSDAEQVDMERHPVVEKLGGVEAIEQRDRALERFDPEGFKASRHVTLGLINEESVGIFESLEVLRQAIIEDVLALDP